MALTRDELVGQELAAKKRNLQRRLSIAQRAKDTTNKAARKVFDEARVASKATYDPIAAPLLAAIAEIDKKHSGETALE